MRGLQRAAGNAVGLQRGLQRGDVLEGAGGHAGRGAVVGGERKTGPEPAGEIGRAHAHRQHRACGLRLHERAAAGDQPGGILEPHHAGDDGRDELAHAVADQRMRTSAQCQQPAGECVFEREDRGLRGGRGC